MSETRITHIRRSLGDPDKWQVEASFGAISRVVGTVYKDSDGKWWAQAGLFQKVRPRPMGPFGRRKEAAGSLIAPAEESVQGRAA